MLKQKAGTNMRFLQWKQGQLAQNSRKIMFAGCGIVKLREIAGREIAAAGNCSRKTGVSGSHYSHREICSNCAEQLRTGVGFPSWLTFLGHMKDSLWSCDLFRCESATLRTYWVLVVMDQFTRRIVGFGVQGGHR
jgi:hypothetical protein